MSKVAFAQQPIRVHHPQSTGFTPVLSAPSASSPSIGLMLQRKSSCPCGGGCPTCQAKSSDLTISKPHDPAEIEADQIADQVMRMPDDISVASTGSVGVSTTTPIPQRTEVEGEQPQEEGSRCPSWRADPESISKRAGEFYARNHVTPLSQATVERIQCEPPIANGNYGCYVYFSDGLVLRVLVRETDIVVGTGPGPITTEYPPPATPLCFYEYSCPDGELVLTVKKCQSAKPSGTSGPPMVAQRAALSSAMAPRTAPSILRDVLNSSGQQMDSATRAFFEPRFGFDLSRVRIHSDPLAAQSAESIQARAYTVGNNIVFGGGEHQPHSESGRRLLAHEIAHLIQQSKHGRGNVLHRRLTVDAAASDDPATAISMIAPLITSLCPDFQTNGTSGAITPKNGTPCSIPRFRDVASGSHRLGCCCLCTMTRPWGADWRILVSSTDAPTTSESSHTVRMTPTSGPNAPELRHWTTGPVQTVSAIPPAEGLGHELCGHAALMKIRAHPGNSGDRAFTDEHDPTVRVQNALATEMGIAGPRRGLAAGGTHRGESLRVFSIGPFSVNADDPAPFAAQIAAAVAFMNGKPDLMVDTVGFRDGADTVVGISASRARRVRASLAAGITTADAHIETTPGVMETLPRVQPITDGGVSALAIVELRMAFRPGGLLTPIGTLPPAVPVHVGPTDQGRVTALKGGSVNECHQLLASTAWP